MIRWQSKKCARRSKRPAVPSRYSGEETLLVVDELGGAAVLFAMSWEEPPTLDPNSPPQRREDMLTAWSG